MKIIIVAGHRRCGTTFLHDFFSNISSISVLKRKEDKRLMNADRLSKPFVLRLLTNPDAETAVIVHPSLVFEPDTLRIIDKVFDNLAIVFLRRDPYERAVSEFKMFCSITPRARRSPDEAKQLASIAIEHSRYKYLESKIEQSCPHSQFYTFPYETIMSNPLTILTIVHHRLDTQTRAFKAILPRSSHLDRNASSSRIALRNNTISIVSQKFYSWLIHKSDVTYYIAKALKRSLAGRVVQSIIRVHDGTLVQLFDQEWHRIWENNNMSSTGIFRKNT